MKITITFVLGIILGIAATLTYIYYSNSYHYAKLTTDVEIINVGTLKKGTILRIDKGMDEGFTRYILYLNFKSDKVEKVETENRYIVKPYWIEPIADSK